MEMETNGNVLNSKLEFEQPRRQYNVKCNNERINTWLQSQILINIFFLNEINQSPDEAKRRKISCKSFLLIAINARKIIEMYFLRFYKVRTSDGQPPHSEAGKPIFFSCISF